MTRRESAKSRGLETWEHRPIAPERLGCRNADCLRAVRWFHHDVTRVLRVLDWFWK